jgi:hypothetical protein
MIRLSFGMPHALLIVSQVGRCERIHPMPNRSRVASILWHGLLACLLAPVIGTFLAFLS